MPDRINEIYPIEQFQFNVTNNGSVGPSFPLKNISGGFFILFGALEFTDGIHELEVQDELNNPLPSTQLVSPEVVKEVGLDPRLIIAPGGMVDFSTNVARISSVLDAQGNALQLIIKSSSVTTGARILIQVFGYPYITPTQEISGQII
jgi:hypothetical protein